jgi:RNA polymerase sigma-70 factor (ECF subfamily)
MGFVVHLVPISENAGDVSTEALTFEAFFTEHRRALSSYLRRRMPSEADVQEVVQESYARILSYGYGCSRHPNVWKALLYRIATNIAHSRGRMDRAQNKAGHTSLDELELTSDAPSQERVVSAKQELQIVRQTILALPPKCQKVFLLSRTHRKTYPEIAEMCGISVKMVEKHISQALAALRRELGGRP